ncbi:MAG: HD domain-containing protein [Candidatus Mariimomonas ferrooxydans]
MTLKYPVLTLDKKLLFPEGTEVTKENLDKLISQNQFSPLKHNNIIQHGSIRRDLLYFINASPYNVIFTGPGTMTGLINFIKNIRLDITLLQSLDYFRENDFYTYRHSLLVFALASLMSQRLISGHNGRIIEASTGPTHDIGKICVPLNILKKSTPLARTEWGVLEHHVIAGYVLLSFYLKEAQSISSIVARDHHERKDGSGYPRGICQDDIMVELIAVCDVYDALISQRPYRPVSYDNRTALEEITSMAKKNKIGWETVKVLIALNRKNKPQPRDINISNENRGIPPENNVYGVIVDEESD